MNRFLHALLPAALLMLVFAISSALIAAAWLMLTFWLNGVNRFTLPMGLFSLALWLNASPTVAQPRAADEYIVIHERSVAPQTALPRPTPSAVDTSQRTQPVGSKSRTRNIKPVPAWPDEPPADQSAPDRPTSPLFIFIPNVKPGSMEIRGLYGIRIRP